MDMPIRKRPGRHPCQITPQNRGQSRLLPTATSGDRRGSFLRRQEIDPDTFLDDLLKSKL